MHMDYNTHLCHFELAGVWCTCIAMLTSVTSNSLMCDAHGLQYSPLSLLDYNLSSVTSLMCVTHGLQYSPLTSVTSLMCDAHGLQYSPLTSVTSGLQYSPLSQMSLMCDAHGLQYSSLTSDTSGLQYSPLPLRWYVMHMDCNTHLWSVTSGSQFSPLSLWIRWCVTHIDCNTHRSPLSLLDYNTDVWRTWIAMLTSDTSGLQHSPLSLRWCVTHIDYNTHRPPLPRRWCSLLRQVGSFLLWCTVHAWVGS